MILCRVCPVCQGRSHGVCVRCEATFCRAGVPASAEHVDRGLALYEYRDSVRQLMLAAKNGGRRDLLASLGARLGDGVSHEVAIIDKQERQPWTITWIPGSAAGVRRRGYDQARLLARSVSRQTGFDMQPMFRREGGRAQTGSNRSQRLVGPELRCRIEAAPERVVLVDDVWTTGASMSTAAGHLRSRGARFVLGAAVAMSP